MFGWLVATWIVTAAVGVASIFPYDLASHEPWMVFIAGGNLRFKTFPSGS